MPRNCHKSPSSESNSSDESYSSSVEDVKVFIKHKHAKKHSKKHDSDSEEKHHRKKNDSDEPKRHHKKESSSEESEKCKKKRNKKDSSSEESQKCSDEKKFCFDDVYKYYKHRLLTDDSLMVAGSDAYLTASSSVGEVVPQNYPVLFPTDELKYNIDHADLNAPFCVRQSGVYILFFIANSEQSSQFTLFINGLPQLLTTTGNNAGSGQTVFRCMAKLNKNDTLFMRNYESNAGAVTLVLGSGGSLVGNDATFLVVKIANLPNEEYKQICHTWSNDCLSRRKQYLFKKILEKMLNDKELMLKSWF